MHFFSKILFLFLILLSPSLKGQSMEGGGSCDLLIANAHLITGTGSILENATIAIKNGRISKIVSGPSSLNAGKTIHAEGKTVIPGLIDAHVHLIDTELVRDENSFQSYLASILPHWIKGMLLHGITTMRSAGDPLETMLELRRSLSLGSLEGPRLFIVGPSITAPGGHPAGTLFLSFPAMRVRFSREVATPGEGRKVVRDLVRNGVDSIKVIYQGNRPGEAPYLFSGVTILKLKKKVLQAVIQEGHRHGLLVTAHTWDYEDALTAVVAGVDGINHGVVSTPIPDDRLAREMLARGTSYVSTLRLYLTVAPDLFPVAERNLRLLFEKGVPIVMGSDTPVGWTYPGLNSLFEIELLVEAGLPPLEAIRAATLNAAVHLGVEDVLGSVQVGKFADLVILHGDPLSDIKRLRDTAYVIKAGTIVRGPQPLSAPID